MDLELVAGGEGAGLSARALTGRPGLLGALGRLDPGEAESVRESTRVCAGFGRHQAGGKLGEQGRGGAARGGAAERQKGAATPAASALRAVSGVLRMALTGGRTPANARDPKWLAGSIGSPCEARRFRRQAGEAHASANTAAPFRAALGTSVRSPSARR